MNHTEFILKTVEEITDINLKEKNRRLPNVMARCLFYHFMRKYIKCSLVSTGKMLNRDHATVLHSLKSFDMNMNDNNIYHKDSFKVLHYKINRILEPYFDAEAELKEEIDFDRYLEIKRDLEYYKIQCETQKKDLDRLTKMTSGDLEHIKKEILKLPEDKIEELYEYRIKPFIRMNVNN